MTDRPLGPIGLSVDDLARALAGAAVLNGSSSATWDQLDESARDQHRKAARDVLARQATVIHASEIELDGGDVTLQELSVGDPIEIEEQTGPLCPGVWVITAFEADDHSAARVRQLTSEEIQAARAEGARR